LARRLERQDADNEPVHLKSDAKGLLFDIDNADRFTSFQFDVEVPEGADLIGVEWVDKSEHTLRFAKNGEDCYRVVALSLTSSPLTVTDRSLLRLRMSNRGHGNVSIENVLFVTPEGKAARFNGSTIDLTTGVQSIPFSQGEQIYDISGRRLNMKREQLKKGVYIINKRVVVK
jgi:hypothetical protein